MERRLPRFLFDLLTEDLDCLVNLHKIRDDAQQPFSCSHIKLRTKYCYNTLLHQAINKSFMFQIETAIDH